MLLLRIAPIGVLSLKFILVFQNSAEGTRSYVALGRNVFLLSWWQAVYPVDNLQLSLDGKGLVPCFLHPQLVSTDLRSRGHARSIIVHMLTRG